MCVCACIVKIVMQKEKFECIARTICYIGTPKKEKKYLNSEWRSLCMSNTNWKVGETKAEAEKAQQKTKKQKKEKKKNEIRK